MPLYLVSYDLLNRATFGDYENLISALRQLGAQRVLLSEWVLRNNATSSQIRDHLTPHIHANDRILVCEMPANWASRNAMVNINDV
jgi:endonuclease/exonuclease/phosphatase (EEP) superfamily protein YafD